MSVCPECLTVYTEYDNVPPSVAVRCTKCDKVFYNNPNATIDDVKATNKANEDKIGFIMCPTCGQPYKPGSHRLAE